MLLFLKSVQSIAFHLAKKRSLTLDLIRSSNRALGKFATVRVAQAGSSVLRHLLGQAMQVAARYDPEPKAFYNRLASRRSKSIAKTAATRKLLIRLFIMLRYEIDYAEFKRRGSAVGMPVVSHGLK